MAGCHQKTVWDIYWPQLKKLINAFVEEGLISQVCFAEGGYNSRPE